MESLDRFLARVGQRVRLLRQQRGLSIEAAAHRAEIRPSYWSQVERGVKFPSLKSVHKMSARLGVTPAELLSVCDEEQRPLLGAEIQEMIRDRSPEDLVEIIGVLKSILALSDRNRAPRPCPWHQGGLPSCSLPREPLLAISKRARDANLMADYRRPRRSFQITEHVEGTSP